MEESRRRNEAVPQSGSVSSFFFLFLLITVKLYPSNLCLVKVYIVYIQSEIFFFGTMISEGKCADSSSTVPGVADQDLRITEKSIRPHQTTRGFGKSGKHASSNI